MENIFVIYEILDDLEGGKSIKTAIAYVSSEEEARDICEKSPDYAYQEVSYFKQY